LSSEPLASPEIQCRVSWPRSVAEARRLSWGQPVSQGFASSDVSAPIGLARLPFAVVLVWKRSRASHGSALGHFRHCRLPSPIKAPGDPLTDSGSPPEFYQRHTAGFEPSDTLAKDQRHRTVACSSRGFFPYSVFPATGSHIVPTRSHLAGYVASSGFRTLTTLCSPHGLPGLFHPGPAHGVYPPRPSSLDSAVRPLGRRCPPGVESDTEIPAPPSGLCTPPRARPQAVGFSHKPVSVPPWASSPPGFLATCQRSNESTLDPSPRALSRLGRNADLTAGAPGY